MASAWILSFITGLDGVRMRLRIRRDIHKEELAMPRAKRSVKKQPVKVDAKELAMMMDAISQT